LLSKKTKTLEEVLGNWRIELTSKFKAKLAANLKSDSSLMTIKIILGECRNMKEPLI
jgi:hypothetical protein